MTHFVWQQLSEMQKCLGGLEKTVEALARSIKEADDKHVGRVASIDARLSGIETSLGKIHTVHTAVKWGAIVASALGALVFGWVTWVAVQVWDVAKPVVVERLTTPAAPPINPPAPKAK